MGELIDKAKGKLKEAEGKLTGNKAREAEGVADQLKGKAKGAFETVKTDVKRAVDKVSKDRERDDQKRP